MRGLRIQNIVNELAGEKIDVVEWNTDLRTYIANALSPAKVQSVILDEDASVKTAIVVVPDRQLSLAIGKEGQNARLAAKLTGWRIDIKSESEAREEGLDLLAVHQAQRQTTGGKDLMSIAERILQSDNPEALAEERLRQAAETIQRMDAERDIEDLSDEMASWPDSSYKDMDEGLRDRDESKAALDAFERAAAAISSGESRNVPAFEEFVDDDDVIEERVLPKVEPKPLEQAFDQVKKRQAGEVEEESTQVDGEEIDTGMETVEGGELPQIITADMLRQRMTQRRSQQTAFGPLDDIEVPEELLVGIDEEEDDFEERDGKRTKKSRRGVAKRTPSIRDDKPEKKKAKPKRGKRGFDDLDELDDLDRL